MQSKKNYILGCVKTLLNLPQQPKSLQKSSIIDKFLSEEELPTLILAFSASKGFKSYNLGDQLPEGSQLLHITKVGTSRDLDNPSQTLSISLRPKDPMQFLLKTLKGLYNPIIKSTDPTSVQPLQDLVLGLESGSRRKTTSEDDLELERISDEFEFWQDTAIRSATPKASFISQTYTRIDKQWKNVGSIELTNLKDLIESTWSAIGKIWDSEYPYNQKRLVKVVDLVAQELINRITSEFKNSQLWAFELEVKIKLIEAVDLCRTFQRVGSLYQQQLFKRKANPFGFKNIIELESKLLMAIRIRTQIEQLSRINRQSPLAFSPEQSLLPMLSPHNLLTLSPTQTKPFNQALQKVKSQISSCLPQCLPYLAKELSQSAQRENGQTVLNCLKRWENLLKEEQSNKGLQKELEQAAKVVAGYFKQIEAKTVEEAKKNNMVAKLLMVRAENAKVGRVAEMCGELLQSAQSYEQLIKAQQSLQNTLDTTEKQTLKSLRKALQTTLSDPNSEPCLKSLGRRLELSYQSPFLVCVTPSQTFQFVTDLKQIFGFGYVKEFAPPIWQAFELAKRYYKEHCILRQLVSNINAMENRMIECQKPMIKKEMEILEDILRNPKGKKKKQQQTDKAIVWDSVEQLQQFIETLTRWQGTLTESVKKLHTSHSSIQQSVLSLLSHPLTPSNFSLYSQKLQFIQRTIDSASANRDSLEWRKFWDYQISKVIENTWREAVLEGVKITMTIQLVMNAKTVSFRPEIFELKEQYYNEMKVFVGWPLRVEGVGGAPELYQGITDRNSEYLVELYCRSEDMFRQIEQFAIGFRQWEQIASLDIESLEDKLTNDQLNQSLTTLTQQKDLLDRLPSTSKISTITIDLAPFKSSLLNILDTHIQSLINLIRGNIKKQSQDVETFITGAMEKISKKPTNMEEMAEVLKNYEKVKAMQEEMARKVKRIEEKNIGIRAKTGVGFNTGNMLKRWENFEMASNDFERVLGEQKNNIRQQVNKRAQSAEQQSDKMLSKWQQIKPKTDKLDKQTANAIYSRMKDWQLQWSELQAKVLTCISDSQHFNMKPPDLASYNRTKKQLDDELGNWKLFAEYSQELEELQKEPWMSFRGQLYKFTDLTAKFQEKAKQSRRDDMVLKYITQMLESNKVVVNLLKSVNGENFEREHWAYLINLLKIQKMANSPDKLTFGHLLQSDLFGHAQEIRQLQVRAKGQVTIRDALSQLQLWTDSREFELSDYASSGRITPLIKQWSDLMTEVSDHQSLVASLRESKFSGRFKEEIQQYDMKFAMLYQYLERLNQIQRKWVYLEPIFMRGALPEQQGRWKRLDEDYRNIMINIGKEKRVIELCAVAGFKQTLDSILQQLERCQKALNDFLQEKRNKFPRFYFIGDDDLLQILGQSQNPAVIQQHLKKLFSGIQTVTLTQLPPTIVAMNSSLFESVRLIRVIDVDEIVEKWLEELNQEMVETLKTQLEKIAKDKHDMFNRYPSQVICLNNEIAFSNKVIEGIENSSLARLLSNHQSFLAELTSQCHDSPDLILSKLKSLILDVIHQIDILNQLLNSKVKSTSDWQWFKQLSYSKRNKDVLISMANSSFQYTFEYQGNAPKLVHTPLTDKCYLTLTQAMHMGFGGNPYGPAGTGKTESVKALGQAFARQVLVFNCDQGLDFHAMGRIFTGLVKCGAWGCFDEFNRLLEEQLSAISQQIQVIQEAIKMKERTMNLLGKTIEVNLNSGIFVTLNPAGKGYGGRSKLPDNLKQLFRPVAMSVPDNQLIAEVLLFSEGFKTAKILSRKIITVFTLCRQLLSKQLHYDWGLRALKTILTVAGRLIFQQKTASIAAQIESELLIKALRINTLSKLTFADMNKFVVLIQDVFPGIKVKDIIYKEITEAAKKVFEEDKRDLKENQINKILQFYEATKQRIGAVLVGPSGCGKTTIWKTLKRAYEKLGQQVKVHLINPKSMPRSQLLGNMNKYTREFTEGVLTASAREVIKTDNSILNWIICDGDIDPQWIQSLNSVLDDNHLLTLPTGQRISFGSNVNFIFQTDNLQFASPATVSRMGMIFLNNEDINIEGIIGRWVKEYGNEFTDAKRILEAVEWVGEQEEGEVVGTTRVGLVRSVLSQLAGVQGAAEFEEKLLKGLTSNYTNQVRNKALKAICRRDAKDPNNPLGFYIEKDKVATYADESTSIQSFGRRVLPTKQLKRDLDIIKPWLKRGQHFIIVGKQGCGKSILVDAGITQLQKTQKCKVITIHCNRQTTGSSIIQKLTQVCQKSSSASGRILKPVSCSRQIIILREINLPKPDKYNTIQLISFLQAVITHNGFYDHGLEFVQLGEGIQFICIMKPDSTLGRFPITSRFVSNVRVLWVDYPAVGAKELLTAITPCWKSLEQKLAAIWQTIQSNFPPDQHPHYLFTPRDLNCLVENLKLYDVNFSKEDEVLSALQYELLRQFGDRLVSEKERDRFLKAMKAVFGNDKELYFSIGQNGKLVQSNKQQYTLSLRNTIDFYEKEVKDLKVVLVDEVLALIAAIQKRIIEGGAILLAGSSGNFRRSATNLMAFKHKLQLVSPLVMRNVNARDFNKDMKTFLEIAGGQNKKILLLLEDHQLQIQLNNNQLQKSEILEKVNSLISSGEIPGLFAHEEIEHMVQDPEELKQQYPGKSLSEAFVERLKKNMTIVLSLDHRNKYFPQVCSANPAFFSKCRVIWLDCLKPSSLLLYAAQTLSLPQKLTPLLQPLISLHAGSTRTFCIYLDIFKSVFVKSQQKKGNKTDRLNQGLGKLKQAEDTVDQLTRQAKTKKQLLAVKQKEADESLVRITEAMGTASERKIETEKLERFLAEEEGKIQGSKETVEEELAGVQPLIEAAKKAVGSISKSYIDELRSFMNPPEPVRHVLKVVLLLFGNHDESWNSMKNFVKGCVDKILNFDIKTLKSDLRGEAEVVMNSHAKSFEKNVIYNSSAAAGPLADWVKAVIQYSKVYQKIRPLQNELNTLQAQLDSSRKRLISCRQERDQLQGLVKKLNDDFAIKINQAETLKADLKKAEETVAVAQNLLEKLKDEKVRWEVDKKNIEVELEMVPKYSILTASYITYLSEHPEDVRERTLAEWKKQLDAPSFNFLKFVSSESALLKETALGLPHDTLSLENSQIIFNTTCTTLMMDPNAQATTWLKSHLTSKGPVQLLSQQQPKFMNQLELSIRFGKTLLIQQIDTLQPVLIPILKKDLHRVGSRLMLQIGDKQIDWNETFKLYLASRNSNIELTSSERDLVTFVNFSVTRSGLEGKLLSIIIAHEQPELEKKKQQYLEREEQLKVSLAEMEEKLLRELAESTGNILENKTLIESLNDTKHKSAGISKSLEESEQLQQKLDDERQVYKPLSQCGAIIFITLGKLKKLSPMYRFSLLQFVQLFEQSLKVDNYKGEKLDYIRMHLISIVYDSISIGLLKSHRLAFAITLAKALFEDEITQNEYNVLLGNVVNQQKQNVPRWLDQNQKAKFQALLSSNVLSKVNFDDSRWQQWYKSANCQEKFPQNLQEFSKCLIIQACRSDRLVASLTLFSRKILHLDSLAGMPLNFKTLTSSIIDSHLPALFIVSAGFDPSKELQEHADQVIGRENFKELSMGGGQNDLALDMLRDAAKKGQWLCLKNLHLVVSFLSTLEKEFKSLPDRHERFRLFLTTEPHPHFPSILLENCFKISYEAPPGLKQNLSRILSSQSPDPSTPTGKLQFVLSYFHALIQERRNYIPQGWTKSYEFNYGDFRAGTQLSQEVSRTSKIEWDMLHGLMQDTVYGGRVDNEMDLTTLNVLLTEYFNQEVIQGKKKVFYGQPMTNSSGELLKKLPDLDNPMIYGLPFSIDKTVQRFYSSELINNLKIVNSADAQQLKFSRQSWSLLLKPIFTLWKGLDKTITQVGFKQIKQSDMNTVDPVESFVYMEASQSYHTYKVVKHSLQKLQAVANGSEMLTSEIQEEGVSILTNQVPSRWCKEWEGPELPTNWVKEFARRLTGMRRWVETTKDNTLLKSELDLNDLYHPQILLNALKQKTARQTHKPIDQLKIITSFQPPKSQPLVLRLKNILLQGCNFKNGVLVEPDNDLPEFINLPAMYIYYSVDSNASGANTAPFPLYSSVTRERLLAKVSLKIDGKYREKVVAGVALFLKE